MRRIVTFHRHRFADTAVLFDDELELLSIDELREWVSSNIDFVVLDSETGEDVTRVLLA
jgi:polyhydroxyalkanoate synthesis regulator protein